MTPAPWMTPVMPPAAFELVEQRAERGGVANIHRTVFDRAARRADRVQVRADFAILEQPLVGRLRWPRAWRPAAAS